MRAGSTDHLGEFEQLILFALVSLGEGAYGVSIRQEIEGRADRATDDAAAVVLPAGGGVALGVIGALGTTRALASLVLG